MQKRPTARQNRHPPRRRRCQVGAERGIDVNVESVLFQVGAESLPNLAGASGSGHLPGGYAGLSP
eukprot:649997-Amphidinium_carterae.1